MQKCKRGKASFHSKTGSSEVKNGLFASLATHTRPDRCLMEQSQFVVIAGVGDAFNVNNAMN